MSNSIASSYNYSGAYPERKQSQVSVLDKIAAYLVNPFLRRLDSRKTRFKSFLASVNTIGIDIEENTDDELNGKIEELRSRLRREGLDVEDLIIEAFALIREISHRKLGLRHYDVQLLGGLVMLQGKVVEMETGEGKTLTATLPACVAAMAGLPVHIITVNDYLVQRDADLMGPIYNAFGLSVGIIISGMSPEERKQAYSCDITYCSNKEIAFDYLKDRITIGNKPSRIQLLLGRIHGKNQKMDQLILNGLYFAIVDEVDSVLVDEARTPLIISGSNDRNEEQHVYEAALEIAEKLQAGTDYIIDKQERNIRLTEKGKHKLEGLLEDYEGIWSGKQRSEELITYALCATHLYLKDKHYMVSDNKVHIIDEFSGRVMPDRSWELGMHQMIETKEDCEITGSRETLARISYQRFFRRYLRLCGMTGTAKEVADELWDVYRLPTISLPTHKLCRRVKLKSRIYATNEERLTALLERIKELSAKQQPTLIGTRSVEASEHLSSVLSDEEIPHQVLNALQDEDEANIIALAGQSGSVTVATNMAGRGTDIKLEEGISDIGGLHVILTEVHEARRIDRQLFGRCARQGDNGSYEMILSLDDELIANYMPESLMNLCKRLIGNNNRFSQASIFYIMRMIQIYVERNHFRIRRGLMKMDDQMQSALAFSGGLE